MVRDNRDRYGYRHRRDSDYEMGESMPGDTGESQGTFHDRAQEDANVIAGGKIRSMESYRRSSARKAEKDRSRRDNSLNWGATQTGGTASASTSRSAAGNRKRTRASSSGSISQTEAVGNVVELTVESSGGTRDTMAWYRNHQVHIEGGTPGETVRVELKKGGGYLIGERVRVRE